MSSKPGFSRYEGDDKASKTLRMPVNSLSAQTTQFCISQVLGHYEDFITGVDGGAEMYPWASRFVMGFPLPSWQRPLVWTNEQKVKFIESIWCGVDIGTYMVNDVFELIKKTDKDEVKYREFSNILLDGQQRLSAIEDYITNRFAVPDVTGNPVYWQDLPRIERRRFASFHFSQSGVKTWDESELRRTYDLRAFGGTAHTDDQRAGKQ